MKLTTEEIAKYIFTIVFKQIVKINGLFAYNANSKNFLIY